MTEHLMLSPTNEPIVDEPEAVDVSRAVESLLRFYGDEALSRAALIEQRLPGSLFARRVREQIEGQQAQSSAS